MLNYKNIYYLFFVCLFNCFRSNCQELVLLEQDAPKITITNWIKNIPDDKTLVDKYIVLEFWATWCVPCLKNVPHINSLQETFRDQKDLYFLSITNEEPIKVRKLLERINFTTIVVTDESNQTQVSYGNGATGITRLPLTVLIDKKGIVKWIGSPEQLDEKLLMEFLNDKSLTNKKELTKYDKSIKKQIIESQNKNFFEKYLSLAANDTINYFFEIKESNSSTPKESSMASKLFYNKAVNLKDILFSLGYNPMQVIIDDQNLKTYDLVYKNKDFNDESLEILENQILEYTGYTKNSDSTIVSVKQLLIANKELLPISKAKSSSILHLGKNKNIYYKFTFKDLQNALNKTSNYYYFVNSKETNYYDFEIDNSSDESIVNSLSNFGIIIKEDKTKIQVFKFKKTNP